MKCCLAWYSLHHLGARSFATLRGACAAGHAAAADGAVPLVPAPCAVLAHPSGHPHDGWADLPHTAIDQVYKLLHDRLLLSDAFHEANHQCRSGAAVHSRHSDLRARAGDAPTGQQQTGRSTVIPRGVAACAVLSYPSDNWLTHDVGPPAMTIGVNYYLSVCANQTCSHAAGGSAFALRGLLKGCAEQNALGAYAASGGAYGRIAAVALAGRHLAGPNEGFSSRTMYPCPECWRHLLALHSHMMATRDRPLTFFISVREGADDGNLIASAPEYLAGPLRSAIWARHGSSTPGTVARAAALDHPAVVLLRHPW